MFAFVAMKSELTHQDKTQEKAVAAATAAAAANERKTDRSNIYTKQRRSTNRNINHKHASDNARTCWTHPFNAAVTAVAVRSKIALATLLASSGRTDATAASACRTAPRGTSGAAAFLAPPSAPGVGTVVVAAIAVASEAMTVGVSLLSSPAEREYCGGSGGVGDGCRVGSRMSPAAGVFALAGADGGPGGGRGASAGGAGRVSSAGAGGDRRTIKFSNPPSWPNALMLSTWR